MAEQLYQIMGRHRRDPLPERKPQWLKVKAPGGGNYLRIKQMMKELNLHTVCEEAHCPNIGECWEHGTATFMILGDVCTRSCGFCNVTTGRPYAPPSTDEPRDVAATAKRLGLKHVVVTSVTRDDLPDGGAEQFAEVGGRRAFDGGGVDHADRRRSVHQLLFRARGSHDDLLLECHGFVRILRGLLIRRLLALTLGERRHGSRQQQAGREEAHTHHGSPWKGDDTSQMI
jgi:hypothetical protein